MYEIYGRDNCVWCDRAKETLDKLKLPYKYFNIEKDKKSLMEFKWAFSGARSVPQILILTPNDGDHQYEVIGGYEDLLEWLRD